MLGPGQTRDPDGEIKDTLSVHFCGLLGNTQSPVSLEGGRMPPQPCPVLQPVQKKSVGNSRHTGTLSLQGEPSVQTCRGAAEPPRTQAAGGRPPVRPLRCFPLWVSPLLFLEWSGALPGAI